MNGSESGNLNIFSPANETGTKLSPRNETGTGVPQSPVMLEIDNG